MKLRILFTTSLIIIGFLNSFSQEKIPLNLFEDIFEKSEELSSEGKKHDAYEHLKTLNKNDSNYIQYINSLAYYLINDEVLDSTRFDEVIELTNKGINSEDINSKFFLYVNKSAALLNQKKYKEAIKNYDEALKFYPKSYYIYYQKSIAYDLLEDYSKAVEMLKKSISLNPFHEDSHLKLGHFAYRNNNITEALMCFNFYLLLNPDGKNSYTILEALNTIVSTKLEIEDPIDIDISKDDDSFDELNLVINNHVSLSKKYKISNKLKIALVKQNHLLLEQLKNYEGNDGFFHNKYIKFFNWLRDSKQFDNFCYTICFSIKNENYRKLLDSKINNIKEFIPVAYNNISESFGKGEYILDGKLKKAHCYFNNRSLQAIGNVEDGKMKGYWETYGENGNLVSKGNLDENEQKTGPWRWYFPDGTLRELSNYKDGKLEGSQEVYFKNGKLKYSVAAYVEGKAEGEYKLYNKYGALLENKFFKNDELDGIFTSYYRLGEKYPNYIIPYKDGKIEGQAFQYYINGQKALEVNFVDGKKEGLESEYYINGKLFAKTIYKEGNPDGKFISYFTNGNTKAEGNFIEGERDGNWKYYHRNGKIATECFYLKGKLHNDYKEYDTDGIHYQTYEYKKGDIFSFSFYDKKGELIHSDDKSSGKLNYIGYYPNGNKISEGIYNIKGGKEGEWKYYNFNGVLTNKTFYKENKVEGDNIYYYTNGNIETTKAYKNDTIDGYTTNKYLNGEKYNEGWYVKGKTHGVWKNYHPNGKLSELNYFQNGNLNGEQIGYSIVDDKIISKLTYKSGKLILEEYFDDKSKKYMHIEIPTTEQDTLRTNYTNQSKRAIFSYSYGYKNGLFKEHYPSGKLKVQGNFLNNERHGKWIWYYENGNIESEYNYIYGEIDGEAKNYHENGKIEEITPYDLGIRSGIEKSYTDKGVLLAQLEFYDDRLTGKRYFYSENGHLQLIRHYLNGQIIGFSYHNKEKKEVDMIPLKSETGNIVSYYDNGKKSREMVIEKGLFQGKYVEYYYNGKIHQEQVYKDDKLEGTVTTYFEDGKIKMEEQYTNGYKNGKQTEYYANGKVKKVSEYVFNEKHGKFIEYNSAGKITKEEKFSNGDLIF